MALTTESFNADGINKIFTVASTILSQSHCRIDFYYGGLDHGIASHTWDVINNSVVFNDAPTIDYVVKITISTDGYGLDDAPSDISDVASNIDDVLIVAGIVDEVVTVAGISDEVVAVSTNETNINAVATNMVNVNKVGTIDADVSTVAANDANVTIAATNDSEITTVATDIANVNTVATNITNVNTVAANDSNVSVVATDIDDVKIIADNMDEVTYFADIYQGSKSSAPSLRNNGSALQSGDMYFNETDELTHFRKADNTWSTAYIGDMYSKSESDAFHRRVPMKVKATEALSKGDLVKWNGYNSGEDAIEVIKTVLQTDVCIGIADEDMALNEFGDIITRGIIEGMDTSSQSGGTVMYSVGGGLASPTRPSGTCQAIAYVVKNHATTGGAIVDIGEPTSGITRAGTITEMEAIASPVDNDSCVVTDLDRGGLFIYDSTEVGNDNQGTNFSGWIRQYSGAVNVKWFGALGIGATDAQPAILAALEVGNIVIPKGSYYFKRPIDLIISNRNIVGNDAQLYFTDDYEHTREGTDYEQLYFFNIGTDGTRPNTISSVPIENVNISGITFNCEPPSNIDNAQIVYKATVIEIGIGTKNIRITNCNILNHRHQISSARASIFARSGSKQIVVDNCRFERTDDTVTVYGGGGVVFSGSNCTLTNSLFIDALDAAISLDDSAYSKVIGNTVRNDALSGGVLNSVGTLMQVAHGSHDCVVADNILKGISQYGLYSFNTVATEQYNLTITGNTFDGGGAISSGNASIMMHLDETCRDSIVANNVFLNISEYASGSAILRVSPRNIVITDNKVSDLAVDGTRLQQVVRGIHIRFHNDNAEENIIVTGNIINVGSTSIFLSSGDYTDTKSMIIENNILSANTSDGLNKTNYGVDISNTGTKYIRLNNNSFNGVFDGGEDFNGTWDYIAYFQTTAISHKRPLTQVGYDTKVLYRGVVPPSKAWVVGDVVYNIAPAAAGTIGWVCTASGTPGTWKTFGTIES